MTDTAAHAPGGAFRLAGRGVGRIGYGMGAAARAADASGDAPMVDLLSRAFDLGVRHFDTAQFYGDGTANRLLRAAFGDRRDSVVIATKAGARRVPGSVSLAAAQKPAEVRAAVEENLATLGADHLDVLYLRRMDHRPGLVASGDQIVPLSDQLAALIALRDQGLIRGIGLSHVTLDQVRSALPAGIAAVQNIYHLLNRADEPLLDVCRDAGVAWVPYFPLGGGGEFFGQSSVVTASVVREVAAGLGATPSQVGLAWQLAHAPNTMLIPGTSDPVHLTENVAAGEMVLDAATLARLEKAVPAPAAAPGSAVASAAVPPSSPAMPSDE